MMTHQKHEDLLDSPDPAKRQAAWEAIYLRHQPKLQALAANIMGNPALADEVCQEAFLQAYQHAGSFRGEGSFEGWLVRITTNLCRRLLVREAAFGKKLAERQARSRESAPAMPDEELENAEERARVRRALEKLTAEHRIAVSLSCCEGLESSEIASIMGCPVGTVWSRIYHAKKKLADLLGEETRTEK